MHRATALFSLVNGSKLQTSHNVVDETGDVPESSRRIGPAAIQQLHKIGKTGTAKMLNIDAIHMREINMPQIGRAHV